MEWFHAGGFAMYPLILASLLTWAVVFERGMRYWKISRIARDFHLEAVNSLLRKDESQLKTLAQKEAPGARVLQIALARRFAADPKQRAHWKESVERARQETNQDLKSGLWLLGTIASVSPFVGLFGTVVGILRSFHDMSQTGTGGFAVVAGGISESLIATATGIIVAVIAVLAFNTLQVRWNQMVFRLKLQVEEWVELLETME